MIRKLWKKYSNVLWTFTYTLTLVTFSCICFIPRIIAFSLKCLIHLPTEKVGCVLHSISVSGFDHLSHISIWKYETKFNSSPSTTNIWFRPDKNLGVFKNCSGVADSWVNICMTIKMQNNQVNCQIFSRWNNKTSKSWSLSLLTVLHIFMKWKNRFSNFSEL